MLLWQQTQYWHWNAVVGVVKQLPTHLRVIANTWGALHVHVQCIWRHVRVHTVLSRVSGQWHLEFTGQYLGVGAYTEKPSVCKCVYMYANRRVIENKSECLHRDEHVIRAIVVCSTVFSQYTRKCPLVLGIHGQDKQGWVLTHVQRSHMT